MQNKLGLSDYRILIIEEQIVDLKMSLIDEMFTFNSDDYNLDYLLKLHSFLFGDLYEFAGKISKRYSEDDINSISNRVEMIIDYIKTQYSSTDEIAEMIKYLINAQIFDDGNQRTITTFFANFINVYMQVNPGYYEELLKKIESIGYQS